MIPSEPLPPELRHRFVITPNASMSPAMGLAFFASIALVSGALAGGLWAAGLWPVAPFTALELAGLGAALWYCARCNRYREVVSIGDNLIRVERGYGAPEQVREFNRHWARVELARPAARNHHSRLLVGSHGRRLELGACLPEGERRSLAGRLREVLAC